LHSAFAGIFLSGAGAAAFLSGASADVCANTVVTKEIPIRTANAIIKYFFMSLLLFFEILLNFMNINIALSMP
jgi:hypothetical protein